MKSNSRVVVLVLVVVLVVVVLVRGQKILAKP